VRRLARWGGAACVVAALTLVGVDQWIDATEIPNLSPAVSQVVLDREGQLLRAYTVSDGRWRLPVRVEDVDENYIEHLIAYEDKRFWRKSPPEAFEESFIKCGLLWHSSESCRRKRF